MSDTEVIEDVRTDGDEEQVNEDQEVEMEEDHSPSDGDVPPPPSPKKGTNIHTSSEYMDLEEPHMLDDKKALLEEFERKRRARMITVPTDDVQVQSVLRQHGEPIRTFAEGPADRRNRLKDFLSRKERGGEEDIQEENKMEDDERDRAAELAKEETWYHRGPKSLKEGRMFIVNFSVPRARGRLKKEKMTKENLDDTTKALKQEMQAKLRSYSLIGSQNADTRPISSCAFNATGEMIATSSWSGLCKVWQTSDCKEKIVLAGHTSYVDSVTWHPGAGVNIDANTVNLVSSDRDGAVLLWNLKSTEPIGKLPPMEGRVSQVDFHPSGRFIGACVTDNSWRMYDLQAEEEILFQEGHSKPVHCIGFQKDGALAATGGMDCYGRIWDLRTGRCVMFLSGHNGPLLCLDWSPSGFEVATGSEDNTARIWDVRARSCTYTIPAHSSLISGIAYDPVAGQYITTCSYDGTVKLWGHGSFQPLRTLEGHGQKVMAVDVSSVNNTILTCSFDKTFKLWGPE